MEGYGGEKEAADWATKEYNPHLSLLYHDCPSVDAIGLAEIEKLADSAGVNLTGQSDLGGWIGGRLVLIPTDKPIGQWSPIAEREL